MDKVPSFKERCRDLRQQGLSLLEIANRLNRSKTSVYFHIRDIPLPHTRQVAWRTNAKERLIRINRGRKGKSLSGKTFTRPSHWNPDFVCVVAHLLFDGRISYGACIYHNRSRALVKKFVHQMQKIYPYHPSISVSKEGVIRASFNNVELAAYMQTQRQKLLENIESTDLECKRVFLKAFFDDEGCAQYVPSCHKRLVRGYQHNSELLRIIQNLLKYFSIESTVDLKHREIIISRRKNIIFFHREIGFTAGVRVNGNRTNSVWKRSLEKRTILKRMVDSYRT